MRRALILAAALTASAACSGAQASTATTGAPSVEAANASPGDPARRRPTAHYRGREIMELVRGRQAAIRECYLSLRASDPQLRGRVEVRFEAMPDGSLTSFEVIANDSGSAALGQCVVGALRTQRLESGPIGGPVSVQFPFVFAFREAP